MNLDEWRKHKYLPQQWRKLLSTSGILQAVLEMMDENHPAQMSLRGDNNDDVSPTRAAIELGVTRGYSLYAQRLRLAAVALVKQEGPGEPTYTEPPRTEEETSYER